MSIPDRLVMLDKEHAELSVRKQCGLLNLTRSLVYRPPIEADPQDLILMRAIVGNNYGDSAINRVAMHVKSGGGVGN